MTITRWVRRLLRLAPTPEAPLPSMRYCLEIYEPGLRKREGAATFETSTPFMNVSVGDILNPGLWTCCEDSGTPLRVVRVEHIIFQHGAREPVHKTCIWTEAAPHVVPMPKGDA